MRRRLRIFVPGDMSDLHAEEVEEEEEPQLRKNGGGGNKNGGGKSEGGLVVQTVHRQESIHLFFTPFTTQVAKQRYIC